MATPPREASKDLVIAIHDQNYDKVEKDNIPLMAIIGVGVYGYRTIQAIKWRLEADKECVNDTVRDQLIELTNREIKYNLFNAFVCGLFVASALALIIFALKHEYSNEEFMEQPLVPYALGALPLSILGMGAGQYYKYNQKRAKDDEIISAVKSSLELNTGADAGVPYCRKNLQNY